METGACHTRTLHMVYIDGMCEVFQSCTYSSNRKLTAYALPFHFFFKILKCYAKKKKQKQPINQFSFKTLSGLSTTKVFQLFVGGRLLQ